MEEPGPWTLDLGPWTLDLGPWTLDLGPWTLDLGPWTLDLGPWTLDLGPWTLGPNWTPGTSPGSPKDIVEIPSGTVIYNNNFMIGTLIVGPNGTVDIVGGSLTVVNGVSNSGTIIVEGDPPALTINGPVTVGNIGSFTATGSGDEIQFANGTVDNHGAISALDQGTCCSSMKG